MPVQTFYPRPDGPIASWSETQAQRWIQAEVKAGNVIFSGHAVDDKSAKCNVALDDALEAIRKGRRTRWEPGQKKKTREPTMNMTFEQRQKSRTIGVVTSIADGEPDVVVVTLWSNINL
jgi:hypothetical protein